MGTVLDGKSVTKISGESVFVYISGGSLSSSVSGQPVFVYISGGSISATISGDIIVDISGAVVDISGQTVVAEVSGQPIFVYISGGSLSASVSGQPVDVSGNSVFVYISGGATSVSGAWVDISGETVIAKISGETVVAKISGQTVITSVSGESIFVYISGGSISTASGISGHATSVSNNGAVAISSVVTTNGTYLEWIAFHMTSGAVTSGEFYITLQQTSSTAFKIKLISINPAANTVFDIMYQPDNRLLLLSGAAVTVIYSNPDSREYGCELMFSD